MAVTKREGSKYYYIQFQYDGRIYIKSSKTTDKLLAQKLESQWRMQLIEHHQLGIKAPLEIPKAFQLYSNSKTDIGSHKRTVGYCSLSHLHLRGQTRLKRLTSKKKWLISHSSGVSAHATNRRVNQVRFLTVIPVPITEP